jgi:hypothetical protein
MLKRTKKEKEILSECRKIIKLNPKLKKRKLNKIKDLEKRLYYLKVWYITETQPLSKLKNSEKRCFFGKSCYHLDHIYPISLGFKNKIPPEVIGNIKNIRFIPAKENMDKGNKTDLLTEQKTKKLINKITKN